MIETKQKILAALDCALDDLSEARLIDILLDAYQVKKKQAAALQLENSKERFDIVEERKQFRREQAKNCATTTPCERYFISRGKKIAVRIEEPARVILYERVKSGPPTIDALAVELSRYEWDKFK